MSAFEFVFGFVSLLLGLAFAHIAQCVAKLVVAGKNVRWDWLSPLAALNAFQLGLIYWWFQYSLRDDPVVLGSMVLKAAACLMLYMMAVASFPDVERDEKIDLRDHFDRSRRLYYVCWIAYQLIVSLVPQLIALANREPMPWPLYVTALNLAVTLPGLFIRNRWLQTAVLAFSLITGANSWLFQALS